MAVVPSKTGVFPEGIKGIDFERIFEIIQEGLTGHEKDNDPPARIELDTIGGNLAMQIPGLIVDEQIQIFIEDLVCSSCRLLGYFAVAKKEGSDWFVEAW